MIRRRTGAVQEARVLSLRLVAPNDVLICAAIRSIQYEGVTQLHSQPAEDGGRHLSCKSKCHSPEREAISSLCSPDHHQSVKMSFQGCVVIYEN